MTERVKICQVVLKSQNGQTLTGARVPPHQETSQQPLNRSQCSRLFNRQRGKINDVPIHSAFDVGGQVEQVESPLFHFSKATISVKNKTIQQLDRRALGQPIRKKQVPIALSPALLSSLRLSDNFLLQTTIRKRVGRIYWQRLHGLLRIHERREKL